MEAAIEGRAIAAEYVVKIAFATRGAPEGINSSGLEVAENIDCRVEVEGDIPCCRINDFEIARDSHLPLR